MEWSVFGVFGVIGFTYGKMIDAMICDGKRCNRSGKRRSINVGYGSMVVLNGDRRFYTDFGAFLCCREMIQPSSSPWFVQCTRGSHVMWQLSFTGKVQHAQAHPERRREQKKTLITTKINCIPFVPTESYMIWSCGMNQMHNNHIHMRHGTMVFHRTWANVVKTNRKMCTNLCFRIISVCMQCSHTWHWWMRNDVGENLSTKRIFFFVAVAIVYNFPFCHMQTWYPLKHCKCHKNRITCNVCLRLATHVTHTSHSSPHISRWRWISRCSDHHEMFRLQFRMWKLTAFHLTAEIIFFHRH